MAVGEAQLINTHGICAGVCSDPPVDLSGSVQGLIGGAMGWILLGAISWFKAL